MGRQRRRWIERGAAARGDAVKTAAVRTQEAAADNAGARGRPRSGGSARLAARPLGIPFADSRGPALTIGRADDPAEREADSLAAQIFSGETPLVPRRSSPAIRRACAACAGDDDEDMVRREAVPGGDRFGGTAAPPSVAGLMARPGRALDPVARGFFERRFGRRFGDVAIHDGPAADTAARAIGARAFTAGSPHRLRARRICAAHRRRAPPARP